MMKDSSWSQIIRGMRMVCLSWMICLSTYSVFAADYLSPADLDLCGDGAKLLITERTGRQLAVFDTATDKILQTIKLKEQPTGAAVSADGRKFYVTVGVAPGSVLIIDAASGKIIQSIPAGHSPVAPLLSGDGRKLYVCNRFENAVSVIDLDIGKKTTTIPVRRDPVAAAITPDGRYIFVVNHMPDGRSDAKYVASKLSVIDTSTDTIVDTIKLVNGAEGMRGVCVSPDGKYVYATHLMARFQVPTTQIERGWINTNAISVVRVADRKLLYTVLLDDITMGFANPWAIKVSPDGSMLCVSAAGGQEIRLIDLAAMTAKIDQTVASMGDKAAPMHLNTHNDLSFISDISRRIALPGNGPRALVMTGTTIYLAEYFSDSLAKVVLTPAGNKPVVTSIPLGPEVPLTPERRGEIFFNDASLCFQKWQSCASCHSDDGRMDALNWDLLNDGIGNPKNVKSLLLSHQTPPVMALGVRDKAETAVRAGLRYIQFAVRPEKDARDIDAYLRSLKPVPSPKLVNGKLSQAAQRGEKIFQSAGCVQCHPPPLYTDLHSYDVGTGMGQDAGKKFDTPTLIEVWRTAPYMHDGRATTIFNVIKMHNPYDKRGKTSGLTDEQIRDLAEYVESL